MNSFPSAAVCVFESVSFQPPLLLQKSSAFHINVKGLLFCADMKTEHLQFSDLLICLWFVILGALGRAVDNMESEAYSEVRDALACTSST